jgi:LPS O-antigen subunit length determinant protein (WzzB/FepE family)
MLTSLRQRMMDLNLAKSALRTEYTVVTDPPLMPEKPVRPRKAINVAMGAVIGLILSIFWAFGVESLDSWRSKQKKI